jgi:hypothetical protein
MREQLGGAPARIAAPLLNIFSFYFYCFLMPFPRNGGANLEQCRRARADGNGGSKRTLPPVLSCFIYLFTHLLTTMVQHIDDDNDRLTTTTTTTTAVSPLPR